MAGDPSFRLTVEDVFLIKGRGTVVTGRVESGTLKVGDVLQLRGQMITRNTEVAGIEMFRKVLDQANSGDNVGLLLRDVAREEVQRGDILIGVESEGAFPEKAVQEQPVQERGKGKRAAQAGAWMGVALALGVSLGVALDNLALGIGLGVAIGGIVSLIYAKNTAQKEE